MFKESETKETRVKRWSALMIAVQKGDKAAYHQLLSEITPFLHIFLTRRLFNKSSIDDVVQEILLGLHKARHTYRPEQPFENWLFGIARYKTLDAMRQHYKKEKNEVSSETDETFSALLANKDNREAVQDIHNALDQLPTRQRKIITLAKIEGHSLAEVANIEGMTESAVKVTIHRAYKKMAEWLVKNGYE